MLNKDSNLRADYKQRAELALAVLGCTSAKLVSHHLSGATALTHFPFPKHHMILVVAYVGVQ